MAHIIKHYFSILTIDKKYILPLIFLNIFPITFNKRIR
ncbi:hypothetical protein HMPREF1324_0672 [Rothia aeria F0474]|uniref:Uncharacterized protein n=1 Tax=Rothia aeria F0474 TaxID=1125724 RepID=I0UTJ7_9MICC|nr:hypothetical protein HMPREF1324_0672 [Rothia aeria F0474]